MAYTITDILKEARIFVFDLPEIKEYLEVIMGDADLDPDMILSDSMVPLKKVDITIKQAHRIGKLQHFLREVEEFYRRHSSLGAEKQKALVSLIKKYEAAVQGPDSSTEEEKGPFPDNSFPSRAPIMLALEEEDDPIPDSLLLKTERYLTISLSSKQVGKMEELANLIEAKGQSMEEILKIGNKVWNLINQAQKRLKLLLENSRDSEYPQPIAWAGKADFLLRIYKAILVACSEREGKPTNFVSIAYGNSYFYPLFDKDLQRNMQKRKGDYDEIEPLVAQLSLQTNSVESMVEELSNVVTDEIILVSSKKVNPVADLTIDLLSRMGDSATRMAIYLGELDLDKEFLHKQFQQLPCVVFGDSLENHRTKLSEITEFISRKNRMVYQAAPCVMASMKGMLLEKAIQAEDWRQVKSILLISTWSWVGRPLFSTNFGEVIPTIYPHLMDLRSVSSKEWYFDRVEGIPKEYRAEELLRTDQGENISLADSKFHFYLTGAGGTGKSCFMRYVYEKTELNLPKVLPVWYKIDAPGRKWDEVEERVKTEVSKALGKRLKKKASLYLPKIEKDLHAFLKELIQNLRSKETGIREIVIFIDQLERTFESGDHPDLVRLKDISKKFINLLKEIGVGKGIRIFIASRKQYLPDFLSSYRESSIHGLQFNVLQKIGTDDEQIGFVEKIQNWCKEAGLIDRSVEIDRSAARELGDRVEGNPMKLMLALIQIFSTEVNGTINREQIERLKPWEKLFHLDEQLAAKDPIDWYFMLAMAHAKAEIVRFEEVWWRIRLVDPSLTRRLQHLGQRGLLERLWFLGFLGRTLNTRPIGDQPERLLEFFHANLRDHLIQNVMNNGRGEWRIDGGKSGMPDVWRALDRLTAAARDWDQSQQILSREDIKLLLRQKEILVESIQEENSEEKEHSQDAYEHESIYLLFLRDAEEVRDKLFMAAKECLVLSAIVHEEYGNWAFNKLYPKISERLEYLRKWLLRSDEGSRAKILQYLIELNHPNADFLLAEFILDQGKVFPEEIWLKIAKILQQPLFAGRYRERIGASLLQYIQVNEWAFPADNWITKRVGRFFGASCSGDRNELLRMMEEVAERITGIQNESLEILVSQILDKPSWIDSWVEASSPHSFNIAVDSKELRGYIPPRLELLGAEQTLGQIERHLERWNEQLFSQIGLPLPQLSTTAHESPENELELRFDGRLVSRGDFYPNQYQTLKRLWTARGIIPPSERRESENEALGEVVVWTDKQAVENAELSPYAKDFEYAIFEWIYLLVREHIQYLFGFEELNQFLQLLISEGDPRINNRRFFHSISGNFKNLQRILVQLVKEAVPIQPRKVELMITLQELLEESNQPSIAFLVQKLRELLKEELCKAFSEGYNQLPVILIDQNLEENLVGRILLDSRTRKLHGLRIAPVDVLKLTSSIRRKFQSELKNEEGIPVLVCRKELRPLLNEMIKVHDKRINVLGYVELSPEVQLIPRGVIDDFHFSD